MSTRTTEWGKMAKKASKAARYGRLLKSLFEAIEKNGNSDEVRWVER